MRPQRFMVIHGEPKVVDEGEPIQLLLIYRTAKGKGSLQPEQVKPLRYCSIEPVDSAVTRMPKPKKNRSLHGFLVTFSSVAGTVYADEFAFYTGDDADAKRWEQLITAAPGTPATLMSGELTKISPAVKGLKGVPPTPSDDPEIHYHATLVGPVLRYVEAQTNKLAGSINFEDPTYTVVQKEEDPLLFSICKAKKGDQGMLFFRCPSLEAREQWVRIMTSVQKQINGSGIADGVRLYGGQVAGATGVQQDLDDGLGPPPAFDSDSRPERVFASEHSDERSGVPPPQHAFDAADDEPVEPPPSPASGGANPWTGSSAPLPPALAGLPRAGSGDGERKLPPTDDFEAIGTDGILDSRDVSRLGFADKVGDVEHDLTVVVKDNAPLKAQWHAFELGGRQLLQLDAIDEGSPLAKHPQIGPGMMLSEINGRPFASYRDQKESSRAMGERPLVLTFLSDEAAMAAGAVAGAAAAEAAAAAGKPLRPEDVSRTRAVTRQLYDSHEVHVENGLSLTPVEQQGGATARSLAGTFSDSGIIDALRDHPSNSQTDSPSMPAPPSLPIATIRASLLLNRREISTGRRKPKEVSTASLLLDDLAIPGRQKSASTLLENQTESVASEGVGARGGTVLWGSPRNGAGEMSGELSPASAFVGDTNGLSSALVALIDRMDTAIESRDLVLMKTVLCTGKFPHDSRNSTGLG